MTSRYRVVHGHVNLVRCTTCDGRPEDHDASCDGLPTRTTSDGTPIHDVARCWLCNRIEALCKCASPAGPTFAEAEAAVLERIKESEAGR